MILETEVIRLQLLFYLPHFKDFKKCLKDDVILHLEQGQLFALNKMIQPLEILLETEVIK